MSKFNTLIQSCSYLLNSSPDAEDCRSYLDSRLNKETQEQFGFGFFPNAEKLNLLTDFVNEEVLKELSLLYSKEMADANGVRTIFFDYFEHHPLIMPYKDVYGNIIAIVARSLLSDEERGQYKIPKYKNTQFIKGNHLFGLFEAKKAIMQAGFVYIVEGQFDVIKAMEKGLHNVVALGSSNMTSYQLSLICRYSNNLLLLLDNDEAGNKGRQRIIEKYNTLVNIRNVFLPAGYKDLDDFLSQNEVEDMTLIAKDVQ